MDKDSKFTRDEDGYVAVRTVSAPYSSGSDDKDSMFTRDEDGYVAVRTISGSGGGSGGDQHNLGYYATLTDLQTAHPTAEAGDWAIVGATDTVWIWDTDNSQWVDSDQKGQVTSVNNQTGAVTITEADILPSQTGNSGKFLITNGTSSSWETSISNTLTILTTDYNVPLFVGNKSSRLSISTETYSNGPSVSFGINKTAWSSTVKFVMDNDGAYGDKTSSFYCSGSQSNIKNLGKSTEKWTSIYVTKINNGADVTVPSVGGTLALQIATMPTAGSTYEGTIYQFTGTTDSTYTNGHFYKCVSDGQTPATYSWEEVSLGGSSLPSQTGNAGKFLTTNGTDASWATISALQNTSNTNYQLNITTLNGTQNVGDGGGCSINIGSNIKGAASNTNFGGIRIGSDINTSNTYSMGIHIAPKGIEYAGGIIITNNITTTKGNTSNKAGGIMLIGRGNAEIGSNKGISSILISTHLSQYSKTAINADYTTVINSGYDNSTTVTEDNTFWWGNSNSVYKIFDANGNLPADRLASTSGLADGNYRLRLTMANGVPTLSWVAE